MASFRSFNFVLGGDVVAKGLNALALLAAMRYLTPAEFGDYVFVGAMAIAAYGFFNAFFNRFIVFNMVAEENLPATQLVALALTAAAYLVLASFARFIEPRLALAGLALAAAAIVFDVRRSSLHRVQAFRRYTVIEVLRAGFFLAATVAVLALLDDDRAIWILASLALSYALAAIAIRSAVFRLASLTRERLAASVRALWTRDTLLLMIFFVLLGLMPQLPALLYRPLATTTDYAEFGVAFRYYGLLVSITSAFHVIAMPAIANVAAEQAEALMRRIKLIAFFALGLVVIAAIAGFFIIPLVDGGKYPDAPLLFATMSIGLFLGIFCGIIILVCQRDGRYGLLVAVQFICVAVAAAVIWAFAAERPIAAAAALPVGITVELALLIIVTRKAGLLGSLSERSEP